MKIAVTGASGYIGEHFVKLALASEHKVVALTRRTPKSSACSWVPYELASHLTLILPQDTDAVVHLATCTSRTEAMSSAQEILAAELLIKASQDVGASLIFVSSQTARLNAPTAYGRTKWRIEQLILASGGCVVRPGQVYGGAPRGLFGELLKAVQRLPVLPAFLPAPKVQPIHVDDLVLGILRIAERPDMRGSVVLLASSEPVTFTSFLYAIAHQRLRLSRRFVPVPSFVVAVAVRLIGRRFGLERLRSLFDLPMMATEPDLRRLDLLLRPLDSGMHPAGDDRRRHLLIEGRAFLLYVLGRASGSWSLRSYVRIIENLRGGAAINLPQPFRRWPILLAFIDGGNPISTAWKKEFVWRLDSATVLAEATSFGAQRFLGLGEPNGFFLSFLGIVRAVLSEAGWRAFSVMLSPLIRVVIPRAWEERR